MLETEGFVEEMNTKKQFTCFFGLVRLFVVTPIWYYLLWFLLKSVEANETAFALFWAYFPTNFVLSFFQTIVESTLDGS